MVFLAAGCFGFLVLFFTPAKGLTKNILMFTGPAHVHPNDKEVEAEAHHQGQMNCKVLYLFRLLKWLNLICEP